MSLLSCLHGTCMNDSYPICDGDGADDRQLCASTSRL